MTFDYDTVLFDVDGILIDSNGAHASSAGETGELGSGSDPRRCGEDVE